MRYLILTSALLIFTLACQQQQAAKPPSQQPQEAASTAIGIMQKLVTEKNFRDLGFDSVDEVKQAQVGPPLTRFDIGLEQLKGFKAGTNPDSLLVQTPETIYPVMVNGQVKSSFTLNHRENGYQASSFGNATIIQSLSRYRRLDAADFVVEVPALNLYYLGRRADNRLLFVPVMEDPRVKQKPGEPVPADTVLQELAPLANAYNGLPM